MAATPITIINESSSLIGWAAVAVALVAAMVAWGQWHTARQKLLLDLFQHRFTKYEAFRLSVKKMTESNGNNIDLVYDVEERAYELRFLFPVEIVDRVRTLAEASFRWYIQERRFARAAADEDIASGDGNRRFAEATDAYNMILQMQDQLDPLLSPYLRMDQRLPRTPFQWLKDCWAERATGTE